MLTQPGIINITVPGTVAQALLYWEGQHESANGDDTINVNGTPYTEGTNWDRLTLADDGRKGVRNLHQFRS